MNLKSTNLRIINQQQQKSCAKCISNINLDVHVSTNIYSYILQGGLWAVTEDPKKF